MFGIIYKATSPTGKVYVGQTTKSLFMRKVQHEYRAKKGDRRSAFQAALLDEGIENFTWETIDTTAETQEELDYNEKHWITRLKSNDPAYGYNGTEGGTHYTHSTETCLKISEAHKGKPLSAEHCQKLSESHKGQVISEEARQKMSVVRKGHEVKPETRQKISVSLKGKPSQNKGRVHTDEARQHMSEAAKGRIITPEHRQKLSEANTGKHHTAESRRKMRDSQIIAWQKRKAAKGAV